MKNWIDFKELRSSLDFEQVLRYYRVEVSRKGDQHHGFCPLPNHSGKKNSPSFSANLKKGIFQCFGCGAKGNILDFAAMMENIDPKDGAAFRKVALDLKQRFCSLVERPLDRMPDKEKHVPKAETAASAVASASVVNAPLDFELKGLDQEHPYLGGRGFLKETAVRFGLGFCSRGLLKERVAIPLHDQGGNLIGYAGRVVDDSKIANDNPKYLFPGSRERGGKTFEFRKSLFVYNGFRIKAPVNDLVIVEGFTSVWWLSQNGFAKVVALMGWACSEEQAKLLVSLVNPQGRVWILSDGDEAGVRCATNLFPIVAPHRFIRWVKLDKKRQPTNCSQTELAGLLGK